jgi:RNA polymerase sigma-70 factor (ECF subfamily)
VDEYLPRVYRFALRLTGSRQEAEDLAQETLLKAWRSRGQLRDARTTVVWLFTICRNLWNDQLRRKARRPSMVETSEDQQSAAAAPDHDLIVKDDLRLVLQAMNSLPARQREVLHLHACEGLSLREIAEVLQITPEAAKASLCEARKRLRRQFGEIDCAARHDERDVP